VITKTTRKDLAAIHREAEDIRRELELEELRDGLERGQNGW
jgi:hypothetical protein